MVFPLCTITPMPPHFVVSVWQYGAPCIWLCLQRINANVNNKWYHAQGTSALQAERTEGDVPRRPFALKTASVFTGVARPLAVLMTPQQRYLKWLFPVPQAKGITESARENPGNADGTYMHTYDTEVIQKPRQTSSKIETDRTRTCALRR